MPPRARSLCPGVASRGVAERVVAVGKGVFAARIRPRVARGETPLGRSLIRQSASFDAGLSAVAVNGIVQSAVLTL